MSKAQISKNIRDTVSGWERFRRLVHVNLPTSAGSVSSFSSFANSRRRYS